MIRMAHRDERETTVDLAADRIALLVLSYGILLIVAWRAFALREASWDLLALLVGSGLVSLAYRLGRRAMTRDLALVLVAAAAIAAAAAVALGLLVGR